MAKWQIDRVHSSINFAVKHMMISTVRGKFEDFDATLDYDPENPSAASVEATIRVASITTGAADRDNHLRSADFFDAENHPTITFKSTRVEVGDDNEGKITGDLTIRGVTRSVTLDVDFLGEGTNPYGTRVLGFEADTKVNREDYGLMWNVALEAGGVLVGKDIKISLDTQFNPVAVTETA